MSLTGMVLGTVLSKEGVAAVAEPILTAPSIYTSDTATVCACENEEHEGRKEGALVDTCR